MVDWREIDNAADAATVAELLLAAPVRSEMWISIGAAIDFFAGLFSDNGFRTRRQVLDVSDDG